MLARCLVNVSEINSRSSSHRLPFDITTGNRRRGRQTSLKRQIRVTGLGTWRRGRTYHKKAKINKTPLHSSSNLIFNGAQYSPSSAGRY